MTALTAINANFHTHSKCSDGADTPESIVLQALELGMTRLGFSDHIDPDPKVSIKDFPEYLKECARLRDAYADRLEILIGAELDNMMPRSAAEGVEYIIGSTHYLAYGEDGAVPVDYMPEAMLSYCREHLGGDLYLLAKRYYELEAQLPERMNPTIIGHFDLIMRNLDKCEAFDSSDKRYRMPALETMEYLVSKAIPFEVNCGAVNRGARKDYYPDMFLLKKLRDFGGEIFINSDAHQKELLLGAFDGAVQAAVSCGFDHVNVLTREGSGQLHFKQIGLL